MDFVKSFFERRTDFHDNVKNKVLDALISKTNQNWIYEDGYFSCHVEDKGMLFIVKGDFEPYIFTTLVVLTRNGECYEMDAETVESACLQVNDYLDGHEQAEE